MINKQVRALCSVLSVAALSGVFGACRADDDHPRPCSEATLTGTYLFHAAGWNLINGVAQPKAIVEYIKFNGDGTLSAPAATLTLNTPGGFTLVRSADALGTYTVEPNCTATITFLPGPKFDVFMSGNGRQLALIQTAGVPAGVMEGTAQLVGR